MYYLQLKFTQAYCNNKLKHLQGYVVLNFVSINNCNDSNILVPILVCVKKENLSKSLRVDSRKLCP
jgi:hypothetical protein